MTNYTSLSEATLDIASKLSNTGSELYARTAETLARETPLLAQEYVAWVFWGNLAELVFWIAVFTAFVVAVWRMVPKVNDSFNREGATVFAVTGVVLLGIAAGVRGLPCSQRIIKAQVAPRVVLVEFVADLVKGGAR